MASNKYSKVALNPSLELVYDAAGVPVGVKPKQAALAPGYSLVGPEGAPTNFALNGETLSNGGPAQGTEATAGQAAATQPPVQPFLTPEDLISINDFLTNYSQSNTDIDTNLSNLQTDTAYQKSQTDRAAKQGTSDATDAAVSRGVFQSSIKDAALYDIEAQRAMRQQFLDDKLTNATLNAGTQKYNLNQAAERLGIDPTTGQVHGGALGGKMVSNAQGVPVAIDPSTYVYKNPSAPAATTKAAAGAPKLPSSTLKQAKPSQLANAAWGGGPRGWNGQPKAAKARIAGY